MSVLDLTLVWPIRPTKDGFDGDLSEFHWRMGAVALPLLVFRGLWLISKPARIAIKQER